MKLNYDCCRALMQYFEGRNHIVDFVDSRCIELDGYSKNDIAYSCKILYEQGFIDGEECIFSNGASNENEYQNYFFGFHSITPKGHEFLANTRDDTIWAKAMKHARNLGDASLSLVAQLAGEYVKAKILKI